MKFPATAVAGGQTSWSMMPGGNRIAIAAIGHTPIAVGIGFQIIHGVIHFIMAVGFAMPTTDGAGGRTQFGRRHG